MGLLLCTIFWVMRRVWCLLLCTFLRVMLSVSSLLLSIFLWVLASVVSVLLCVVLWVLNDLWELLSGAGLFLRALGYTYVDTLTGQKRTEPVLRLVVS